METTEKKSVEMNVIKGITGLINGVWVGLFRFWKEKSRWFNGPLE